MTTSMEFDNCDDDEIGSDNIFRRAIEEAIASQRPISIGEYNAFMTSIGALVPAFVIRSLPQLTFTSLGDSVRATAQAIEFIKTHPSLPVSFNIKQAIQVLHDYLQRQETFLALQDVEPGSSVFSNENWTKFRTTSLCEPAVALAKLGKVGLLRVLLGRHVAEISESLRQQGVNLVSGILVHIPIPLENEDQVIGLVEQVLVPNVDEFEELARVLVKRARAVGESDLNLAKKILNLVSVSAIPTTDLTPLEAIKAQVIRSEARLVASIIAPLSELLHVLTVATCEYGIELSDNFNLTALEGNQQESLCEAARGLLRSAIESARASGETNLLVFKSFCENFKIDENALISAQVSCLKDELVSSKKRPRMSIEDASGNEDETSLLSSILYDLISGLTDVAVKCACVYEALIGLNALNLHQEELGRYEDLARDLVSTNTIGDSIELLRSYVSVISVQKILLKYPQFSFIRERPDFLMKRENVMAVVTELSCGDGLADVEQLAAVFTYVDVKECVLLRLASLLGLMRMTEDEQEKETLFSEMTSLLTRNDHELTSTFVGLILDDEITESDISLIHSISRVSKVPESLLDDLSRMTVLLRDFGTSVSRDGLYSRREFQSIEFFAQRAGDDVVSLAKLERAKVVFQLADEESESDLVEKLITEFQKVKLFAVPRSHLVDLMARVSALLVSSDIRVDDRLAQLVDEVVVPLQKVLTMTDSNQCYDKYQWACEVVPSVAELKTTLEYDSIVKAKTRSAESDKVLMLNTIAADIVSESSCGSDYSELELFYTLRSYMESKAALYPHDLGPMSAPMISIPADVSRGTTDGLLANRCQWARYLESLSITFEKEVLFATIDLGDPVQRKNAKKILSETFPEMVKRSGFDLDLALRFGNDFGRSQADIQIKWLELILSTDEEKWKSHKKIDSVLDALLSSQAAGNSNKILTFIIPALQNNDSVEWLTDGVLRRLCDDECILDWKRISAILTLIKSIETAGFQLDFRSIYGRNVNHLVDLINVNLKQAPLVGQLVSLLQLVLDSDAFTAIALKILEKIIAYPDVIVSGQVSVETVIVLTDSLGVHSEKTLRRLIQAIPLSTEQLLIVNHFIESGFSGISESDLRLLQNRLVIRKYGWQLDDKMKELGFSAKKLIEHVLAVGGSTSIQLAGELMSLNEVDGDKLRIDILKQWISNEEPLTAEKASRVAYGAVNAEAIITCLLKLYFNSKISVANRLVCFQVLFGEFDKAAVLHVYNNPIDDLVTIQKQLTYLHSLSESSKVIKPMEYKDFVLLDKSLVVKNIVNAGNKQLLQLAVDVTVDYGVVDFELIEKLETKLKILLGLDGICTVRRMRTKMMRNSSWIRVAMPRSEKDASRKPEADTIGQRLGDENAIYN